MRNLSVVCLSLLALAACGRPPSLLEIAKTSIRGQVSPEIEVTIDPASLVELRSGGRPSYICGSAELDTPTIPPGHPLKLEHVHQRFVVDFNSTISGFTTFDGSTLPEDKAEFAKRWALICSK
jgi:hypothetical protein